MDRRTPSAGAAAAGSGRADAVEAGFGAGFGAAEARAARGLAAGLLRSPAAAGTEARATRLRRGRSATFVDRVGIGRVVADFLGYRARPSATLLVAYALFWIAVFVGWRHGAGLSAPAARSRQPGQPAKGADAGVHGASR